MLFHTPQFFAFFAIVLALFYLLPRPARRNIQDERVDIGEPDSRRQRKEAGFAVRGPDPCGGQRDRHERCRKGSRRRLGEPRRAVA